MPLNEAQRRHARTHHGVFTYRKLRDLGSSRRQVEQLVDDGTLRSPVRGVFVATATKETFEQQCAVVCAANPRAVISHRSAGRLLGLRDLGFSRCVELTIPDSTSVRFGAFTVHRTNHLPSEHIVERPDGIRHTSLLRTVFDVCAVLDDIAVESIFEQILDKFDATVAELFDIATEMRKPGRNGSVRFVRVLGSRPAFRKPAGSKYEVLLLAELRRIGVPDPVRQAELTVPDEDAPLHPDFYWPDAMLAVEVDHAFWHSLDQAITYDKRRDRKLGRTGVHVIRATATEIDADITAVARDIEAVRLDRLRRRQAA